MSPLEFSLEVITPAFVAGVMEDEAEITRLRNGQTVREKIPYRRIGKKFGDGLRVPSLRGVLRFWFRAMCGHGDINRLHQEEAEIFGDTSHGQGLRIIPCGPDKWSVGAVTGGQEEGYLGYGPLGLKDESFVSHNNNAWRDAIIPGATFRFRAIGTDDQIKALRKCLVMLHLFGGIGSRSRRAWGSLTVSADFIPPVDERNFENWFSERLNSIFPEGLPDDAVQYSALTKSSEIRYFSIPNRTKEPYKEIFEEFFEQFKNLRYYKTGSLGKKDVMAEHSDFEHGVLTTIPQRIAFGLPYQPGRRNQWALRYMGEDGTQKRDRRASPLILKVLPGENSTYGIALFLKTSSFFGNPATQMIAEKCEGVVKKGKWTPLKVGLNFNDWNAISAFLSNKKWQKIDLLKCNHQPIVAQRQEV